MLNCLPKNRRQTHVIRSRINAGKVPLLLFNTIITVLNKQCIAKFIFKTVISTVILL